LYPKEGIMDLMDQAAFHGGSVEVIHPDKWVDLCVIRVPKLGINGYTFAHEAHGNGHGVAILPYRRRVDSEIEVLFRVEVVPPWGLDPALCAITGSWDHPKEDFLTTAVRELHEEAGYRLTQPQVANRFGPLGTCRGTKALDTLYYLYAVDVTGLEAEEAPGDGSQLESEASTRWMDSLPKDCPDPLVQTMILRLLDRSGLSFGF